MAEMLPIKIETDEIEKLFESVKEQIDFRIKVARALLITSVMCSAGVFGSAIYILMR